MLVTRMLLNGACVFLLLLPLVDMIDQQEAKERNVGRTDLHLGHLGNQTGVTVGERDNIGTIPGNWNSLSPTLSFHMSSPTHFYQPSPSSSAAAETSAYETLGPLPSSISSFTTKHHRHHSLAPMTTSQTFHFRNREKPTSNGFLYTHKSSSVHQRKGSGSTSFVEPPVSLAAVQATQRITGPYFESNRTTINVSARAGQTVLLDCAVILLQGRTVSWMKKSKSSLTLLTVSNETYYQDSRVGLRFRYPNNWRLSISSVNKADEGEYHCSLSTHPIKTLTYHLKVIAPAVVILDENGHTVLERHYKEDSSLHLTCKANHVDKFSDKVVWLKGDRTLPGGDSRVKVKLTKNSTNGEVISTISIISVQKRDSGNLTCRASSLASSTIAVHVLNGELPAAVQHESKANRLTLPSGLQVILTMSTSTLLFLV